MGINTIKFTRDNTENFSQEVLDKMNEELEKALADLDVDSVDYNNQAKNIQEQIFNKYC